MDKTRKNLMAFSIFIIGFAVYTVISVVLELFMGSGFDNVTIPEGAPENIVDMTKTFLLIVTGVMVLPQFYVGIKGACVAKNPNSSKGHIFWAGVLFVFTLVGMGLTVLDMVNNGTSSDSFSMLIDGVIEAIFYFEFIVYARRVRNEY
jgi:hypothetical protein